MTDFVIKHWPGPEATHCVDTAAGKTLAIGSFDDCTAWVLQQVVSHAIKEADLSQVESGLLDSPPGIEEK